MPTPDPKSFADDWVRAWNADDIDPVPGHFHDGVVFTSRVADMVGPESGVVVCRKDAVRRSTS